jgi:hypothetical protein
MREVVQVWSTAEPLADEKLQRTQCIYLLRAFQTFAKRVIITPSPSPQTPWQTKETILVVIYPKKLAISQKMCHAAKRFQRMGFLS